ncbi:MAG: LemA family protein [Gemmatimonadetes bacterium]|nr:LemA family protein [Gemmatimonadota bacterium]
MGLYLLILVAIAVAGILMYNRLAHLRLLATNAWADIDVQLKRRHDLIPSLVAAVKGHAGYEKGTLDAVVEARNRALKAGGPAAAADAERVLGGSVRQVFAVAEAYPDLQAAESYLSLQRSLTEIEDYIQNARRYYNAVVRDFNVKTQQFPSNLVAGLFGFHAAEFFGLSDSGEGAVPAIDLENTK